MVDTESHHCRMLIMMCPEPEFPQLDNTRIIQFNTKSLQITCLRLLVNVDEELHQHNCRSPEMAESRVQTDGCSSATPAKIGIVQRNLQEFATELRPQGLYTSSMSEARRIKPPLATSTQSLISIIHQKQANFLYN